VSSSIETAGAAAPPDPDPHDDLGYESRPLTVVKLDEDCGGKYMILPQDEARLRDEEFLVADPGSICRLDECR
jgi:hypothetical protein